MKKRKGIWMALLTVILSVAMLMGTTTIGAFALGVDDFQSSNVTFVKKLSYGKETDKFSGATKVVAPSGEEITSLATFTPKEIGAYTVYYGEGYSYVVPCVLDKDSKAFQLYESELIHERHRHRYEVNNDYRNDLTANGMKLSGISPDGRIVEMIEIPSHQFFVATQAHPELKSRPNRPHPLFLGFVEAAINNK